MTQYGKLLGGLALGAAMVSLPLSASAQGDECEIVLGSAISLTGIYSANGINAKNGYDFGVKTINENGGVKVGDKTCKFRIVYYDDESTPARGAQLSERLINQDEVKYMLGPYSSAMTAAIAPITEQYKIPMIEANGASRSLFNKGYQYLFAVLTTSEMYLSSAVDLAAINAKERGVDPADLDIALAVQNDTFSLDVRTGIVNAAKEHGMEVVIDDKLPRDLTDMSATLTKVKALEPDLLLVSGHQKGASTAIRQIDEMGIHAPMIGITHCEAASAVETFGEAANGLLCPTQWAPTLSYEGPAFGTAAEYEKAVKEAYPIYQGGEVPYQTAESTAAIVVYKNAFERAGTLDKEAVRDALAATDMMTFYGPVDFAENGSNPEKPMVLRQIQDGEYKVVAPPEYASDKLVYPRP